MTAFFGRTTARLLAGCLLLLPAISAAAPAVPTGLTLAAGSGTITASWNINSDSATGYYLYWGTDRYALDQSHDIPDAAIASYVFGGLSSSTTYYVAISAYDLTGESARSAVIGATTQASTRPAAPQGFAVTSLGEITASSARFRWTLNGEADVHRYRLYVGTVPGIYGSYTTALNSNSTGFTVSGLSAATRYYLALTALDDGGDESSNSSPLIVDTLTDLLPPETPGTPAAQLTGVGEITVAFNGMNAGMADLAGYLLYYGVAPSTYGPPVDLGRATSAVLPGLVEGTTYYFAVSAYDAAANESPLSVEGSILVEAIHGYLTEEPEEGCFIATAVFASYDHPAVQLLRRFRDEILLKSGYGRSFVSLYYQWGPRLAAPVKESPLLRGLALLCLLPLILLAWIALLPGGLPLAAGAAALLLLRHRRSRALPSLLLLCLLFPGSAEAGEANRIGLKGGAFVPAEKEQRDIYERNYAPFILFYERAFWRYLSAEIGAGYMENQGEALTASGGSTKVRTELALAPLQGTLKLHLPLSDHVIPYLGAGAGYWYYKETVDRVEREGKIGGALGVLGVRLIPRGNDFDDELSHSYLLIEAVHAKIDRFGKNDTDLGGWFFNIGVGKWF